jgi:hypothetical protein
LWDLHGVNEFKSKNLAFAARGLDKFPGLISSLSEDQLLAIPGVGKVVVQIVKDVSSSGTCPDLEQIIEQTPPGLLQLLKIKGLGPKKVRTIWQELQITEIEDLLFASKICKHTKSNTIVFAKNKQLCASGTGQTSRVDALKQAIEKATSFEFDLTGAVMASDAFFPFPDCVEIANKVGITAVIQPGGSIKDELSIQYCNDNNMAMVFTGIRHFKH